VVQAKVLKDLVMLTKYMHQNASAVRYNCMEPHIHITHTLLTCMHTSHIPTIHIGAYRKFLVLSSFAVVQVDVCPPTKPVHALEE